MDIWYLFLKKETNDEINTDLNGVYGNFAPSIATVKYWTAEFKRSYERIRWWAFRSSKPTEIADKIHNMIYGSWRSTSVEWRSARLLRPSASHVKVENILHEFLGMKKQCSSSRTTLWRTSNGQIIGITLLTGSPSTIFSRFSRRLLAICKFQKWFGGKGFEVGWGGHRWSSGLFQGIREIVLF